MLVYKCLKKTQKIKKGGFAMNKLKLESIMKLHGDNGRTLSEFLGIARGTFSSKINETNGAEFTQSEISAIKKKYNLTPDEVNMIFFN